MTSVEHMDPFTHTEHLFETLRCLIPLIIPFSVAVEHVQTRLVKVSKHRTKVSYLKAFTFFFFKDMIGPNFLAQYI